MVEVCIIKECKIILVTAITLGKHAQGVCLLAKNPLVFFDTYTQYQFIEHIRNYLPFVNNNVWHLASKCR